MGVFGRKPSPTPEATPSSDPKRCAHTNREDMRTFGAGGDNPNNWRCTDCGYEPAKRPFDPAQGERI